MLRICLRASIVLVLGMVSGCSSRWGSFSIPLGPWGGPAYLLHTDKIGTGQSAFELSGQSPYN